MIAFQYNKTSLQHLEKQLKMRVRTLPIIKNKESALRIEVKRCFIILKRNHLLLSLFFILPNEHQQIPDGY